MTGPAITALRIADPLDRWTALGFSPSADGSIRVGEVTLGFGASGQGGIVGWTLSGEGVGPVASIATERGAAASGPATEHPNTAVAVDHVVLATPDVDATLRDLADAGMQLRRERRAGSSRSSLRQAFFRHGEAILEVVGPDRTTGEGQDGPSEDVQPRLWGVTLTVGDLDAAARLLGERLGRAHDAVQPGRRIATVRRDAGLSVPLAFMSPPP